MSNADAEQESAVALASEVAARLRDIPDFPEPGILFKDFTPLLADADLSRRVVADVVLRHRESTDVVVGIEARGFVLGAVVAHQLGVGFVPVRKAGKLPSATHHVDYDLEYGSATLEMHIDGVRPGQRVLVVDDVLATGGTVAATVELLRLAGAITTGVEVVLEIGALAGRGRLPGIAVHSLLTS